MTRCHKQTAMRLIDIHTHNHLADTADAIYNSGESYCTGKRISTGIHPWHIASDWESTFAAISQIAHADNVLAIGECGLDTLKSPATLELQEIVFRAHARLAETVSKPLIIHCVKAHDRLMALHKELAPGQAWILHGFRGKPQQAAQLVKEGFYISLGEKFNPGSARELPSERIFIESDESPRPIADIYAAIAAAMGVTTEQLARQISVNARIFRQF